MTQEANPHLNKLNFAEKLTSLCTVKTRQLGFHQQSEMEDELLDVIGRQLKMHCSTLLMDRERENKGRAWRKVSDILRLHSKL